MEKVFLFFDLVSKRARRFADAIAAYLEDRRLHPDAADQGCELGDTYDFSGMYREAVDEYVRTDRGSGTAAGDLVARTAAFSRAGITGYLRSQIEE